LRRQIRAESKQIGTCDFCGNGGVEILDALALKDMFAPIVDLYGTNDAGEDMGSIMQSDWCTFGDLDGGKIVDLLCDITGNAGLRAEKYVCRIDHDKNQIDKWHAFREELKHENRYFPTLIPEKDHLRGLFELLTQPVLEQPRNLFRARINNSTTQHTINDMGMPPKDRVSNGRANPKGVAYFYAASHEKTAISEVRPFVGAIVTVAEFEVLGPIGLVDLRNPRRTASPFAFLSGDGDLVHLYRDMPFLTLLGNELSKPFGPHVADLEYLPSQYLCEFIKHSRFDGVIYRSSLAEGDNYAIFQEDKLKLRSISSHTVTAIDVAYV
jgi:hypothetical protein